jgi:hypothetical protein
MAGFSSRTRPERVASSASISWTPTAPESDGCWICPALDGVPIVPRRAPPREARLAAEEMAYPEQEGRFLPSRSWTPPAEPADVNSLMRNRAATFRYHALDVFADGPPGSTARGAAPRTSDARLRFFATLARPEREGGDTASWCARSR